MARSSPRLIPTAILLFALTLSAPFVRDAAGDPRAADADTLRALHARVLRAHLESNTAMLIGNDAGDFVVANRGEITRPTLDERRARFSHYLGSTRFEVYRDLVEPVVEVSADGTLGWVIAQVEAKGMQTGEDGKDVPIAFVCAWIELYRKEDGRWRSVGNVSNFKP